MRNRLIVSIGAVVLVALIAFLFFGRGGLHTPEEVVAKAFKAIFVDFDTDKAEKLLADDYIQHNPGVPTGAAPVLGLIPALEQSGIKVTTHRILAEGDLVAYHSTYENAQLFGADRMVAFDVFRVEDGKVAENWDNLQEWVPASQTVSGNSMVDGPTEVSDLNLAAQNKQFAQDFVRDILLGAAPDKITDYISTETYIQHNPDAGNGLDGFGAAVQALAEAGMQMTYTDSPLIVAQGNFVLTGSQGTLGDTPTAFYDLLRIEDGKIMEHWDVIAPIPTESANDNGKF